MKTIAQKVHFYYGVGIKNYKKVETSDFKFAEATNPVGCERIYLGWRLVEMEVPEDVLDIPPPKGGIEGLIEIENTRHQAAIASLKARLEPAYAEGPCNEKND